MNRDMSRFREYLSRFRTGPKESAADTARLRDILNELSEKWSLQDKNRKNRRKSVGGKRY